MWNWELQKVVSLYCDREVKLGEVNYLLLCFFPLALGCLSQCMLICLASRNVYWENLVVYDH